jgi:hypothetical protein
MKSHCGLMTQEHINPIFRNTLTGLVNNCSKKFNNPLPVEITIANPTLVMSVESYK